MTDADQAKGLRDEEGLTGWSELSFVGETGTSPRAWWDIPKIEGKHAGDAESSLSTKYALEFIGYLRGFKRLKMEPSGNFPSIIEAMTGVELDYMQRIFLDTIATYIAGQDIVVACGGESFFLAQLEPQKEQATVAEGDAA